MTMMTIDRLSLHAGGLDAAEAQHLARLVAQHLRQADGQPGGGAQSLQVTVQAEEGEGLDALAGRVARDVLRAIERIG